MHVKEGKEVKETDVYVVSLVDHKSRVDYNVSMQLLKYMVCIWAEYEKKLKSDNERDGITRNKGFKYPPIIPIVYYEGKAKWTADLNLKSRIMLSDIFGKYIPDYEYFVVRTHDYSNEELLEKNDAMSLIMILNKIQNKADLRECLKLPAEKFDKILNQSPEDIINIIAAIIGSICDRVNTTIEEREECVRKVVGRQMGVLFESMEAWDVQADRKELEEDRKELAEREAILKEKEKEVAEREKKLAEGNKRLAEGNKRLAEGNKKLDEGNKKLDEGNKKLDEGNRALAERQKEVERIMAEALRIKK